MSSLFEVLGFATDTVAAFVYLFTRCKTGDVMAYKMSKTVMH
jgi:hypothetical protein